MNQTLYHDKMIMYVLRDGRDILPGDWIDNYADAGVLGTTGNVREI